MARYSSSGRWSRPATGAQIRALKSHGGYDGKYYSMGRASQAIGRGMGSSTSSATYTSSPSRNQTRRPPVSDAVAFELLSDLLGVTHTASDIVEEALQRTPADLPVRSAPDPIASVVFDIVEAPDAGGQPTVVFSATVTRDSAHSGDPEVSVRFVSNVTFAERPQGEEPFKSGVSFND